MLNHKRIALLGCGRIATKRHAPLLSNNEAPGATLAAVCDIDQDKARALGEKYKVPWYTSGDEMMKRENPDILSILTPSGLHFEHAMHFMEYGKPLIVEKPVTLVLADARSLMWNSEKLGVPVFTVMQNRFNVPVQHLFSNRHRLGHIISANVCVRWSREPAYYQDWHGTWMYAGGVLANQAIHHVDLLTWLLGLPKSVVAYASHTRSGEVEDTLVALIHYDSGTLATMELTASAYKDIEGSVTILGTNGTVKVGGFAVNKIDMWQFNEEIPGDDIIRDSSENPPNVYGYGHCTFYEHVLDCLQNNQPSFIDGRESLEVVTALYQSVEEGREVNLSDGVRSARLGSSIEKI